MSHLAHKHIVIAEDEVATLRSLIPFLQKQGCKVSNATNGKEAINLILSCHKKKEAIDLVLSDMYMPDLTGWEVSDKLIERGIQVPFLFMTGDLSRRTKVEFEKRNCNHFLQKPFTHKELLDAIEKSLQPVKHHTHTHLHAQPRHETKQGSTETLQ